MTRAAGATRGLAQRSDTVSDAAAGLRLTARRGRGLVVAPGDVRRLSIGWLIDPGIRPERLHLSVSDTGVGIEDLTRIFTRGYTTRDGGHGFGLHSCALAATEMGGSLAVRSDGRGRGATFTLELPVQPSGADAGTVTR